MFCRNCGAEVETDWLFCDKCGTKVEVETEPETVAETENPIAEVQIDVSQPEQKMQEAEQYPQESNAGISRVIVAVLAFLVGMAVAAMIYNSASQEEAEWTARSYYEGVANYEDGRYEEARMCFEQYDAEHGSGSDMSDSEKYLKLIEVRQSTLDDVSELRELIDFADTKEILMMDQYLDEFLMGSWRSGSETIEYDEDGSYFSIPRDEPNVSPLYYQVEDGAHWLGNDDDGWTKQFEYTILDWDTVRVYSCVNGRTYIFQRD